MRLAAVEREWESAKELELRPKDIPWLRVFLEGAVIVGSILLAFALDAWWDNRNREDELREQLQVVAGEMESTRQALQRALSAHELNAHLAEQLTSALGQVAEGSEVVVSDTLIGPLLPQVTADVTTGSLDSFIAAGGLELVDDADIRRHLLEWPTRIQDLQDDEIYLRNFAAAELASYLRVHSDVANAERLSTPLLRARFGAGPPVDSSLLGTVTLRREQHLMNLLAARESGERTIRPGLVEMVDQAARIVAALEGLQ
ncbi:MAG: hypothetical protein JSU98_14635 [Gemmatimonadales bacterium]|nr:MAG: hypothetical protein JSU98_14635 [Gemmatimonadales bacterium]